MLILLASFYYLAIASKHYLFLNSSHNFHLYTNTRKCESTKNNINFGKLFFFKKNLIDIQETLVSLN